MGNSADSAANTAASRAGTHRAPREKVRKAGVGGIIEEIKKSKWYMKGSLDFAFLLTVIVLLAFGVVMMFSASYVVSYYKNGNSYYFFLKQLKFALAGIVIMLVASRINFRKYNSGIAIAAAGVTLILLLMVLMTTPDEGGTRRRLYFFQPSDVAKFTLVLFLAYNMARQHKYFRKSRQNHHVCLRAIRHPEIYGERIFGNKNGAITANTFFTLWYAAIVGICAVLVLLEHHLSGTILILLVGMSMMAFAGVKKRWFALAGVLVAAVAAVVLIKCAGYESNGILEGSFGPIKGYQLERIVAWLDKSFSPTDARWQINNSLYAIASGGPFGLGFCESRQKQMFVSEPQNDFIFSIIVEELGYVGATVIILLFAFLIYRGFVIAMSTDDLFGSLLVMGIMAQVGFQVVLNIMVVTDTVPNTGISLPFFSYGGTALIMLMGEMGIVLAVSRSSRENARERAQSANLRQVQT